MALKFWVENPFQNCVLQISEKSRPISSEENEENLKIECEDKAVEFRALEMIMQNLGLDDISAMSRSYGSSSMLKSKHLESEIENFDKSAKIDQKLLQISANEKRTDAMVAYIPEIGEVEISPKMAFVQPNQPFTIWVKIRPTENSHKYLIKNRKKQNIDGSLLSGFNVKIVIKYINQNVECPIVLNLRGDITTKQISIFTSDTKNFAFQSSMQNKALEIPPPSNKQIPIFFGPCSTMETKEQNIVICNHSRLPQQIRLFSSHLALSLIPGPYDNIEHEAKRKLKSVTYQNQSHQSLILSLEPLAKIIQFVRFEPKCNGNHHMLLTAQTLWDQKVEILCCGVGITPYVQLDINSIFFPKTAVGNKRTTLIHVFRDQESGCSSNKVDNEFIDYEFDNAKIIDIFPMDKEGNRIIFEKETSSNEKKVSIPVVEINNIKASPAGNIRNSTYQNKSEFSRPSTAIIKLPAKSDSTNIQNTLSQGSSEEFFSRFDVEFESLIQIWPRKGTLRLGERKSIYVQVNPKFKSTSAQNVDLKTITSGSSTKIKLKEKRSDQQYISNSQSENITQTNFPEELQTLFNFQDFCISLLIPIKTKKKSSQDMENSRFIQGLESPDTEKNTLKGGFMPTSTQTRCFCLLENHRSISYLRITIPIVRPDLAVTADSYSVNFEGSDHSRLMVAPLFETKIQIVNRLMANVDFNCVPVKQRVNINLSVWNISGNSVKLRSHDGMNPCGSFENVNALRTLHPGKRHQLCLAFIPQVYKQISSLYCLETDTTRLNFSLVGIGVKPKIRVEPVGLNLFVGDVLIGDSTTRTFSVFNESEFLISCSFENSKVWKSTGNPKLRGFGTVNWTGTNAFLISPSNCLIGALSKQDVTVKFSPDRESDLYFDYVKIIVWGIEEEIRVKVHGRCWDTTTAIFGYDCPPETQQEDPNALPPSFELDWAFKLMETSDQCQESDTNSMMALIHHENFMITNQKVQESDTVTQQVSIVGKEKPVKKGKEKKQSGERHEWLSDDEEIPRLLSLLKRTHTRFSVIECPWRFCENNSKKEWFIDLKELYISNMKPRGDTSTEKLKRPSTAEFSIEQLQYGFDYNEIVPFGGWMFTPPKIVSTKDHMVGFVLEPMKGTVEIGSQKVLKIGLVNPVREFWDTNFKIKESMGGGSSEVNGSVFGPDVDILRKKVGVNFPDGFFPDRFCIESYFKITVKGGVRLVEPKGVPLISESRTWFLKIYTV
ncbi:hypothetical protein HK096_000719 [Nowakowskiella sp. JEL0078]|nr:hypothetical protein HK096_000719 [Nowakowskiella sp. JEL0078]